MKILIADDEFYARKAVVQMVAEWKDSVEIWEAEDGEEAVQQIQAVRPDVVLTDIRMPRMNGIELARHVQQQHPGTFVAIISGFDDFAYAQEAIKYKVEHYLLKPMDRNELYPLLDQLDGKIGEAREAKRGRLFAERLSHAGSLSEPDLLALEGPYQVAAFHVTRPAHRDKLQRIVKQRLFRRRQDGIVAPDLRHDHLLAAWLPHTPEAADHRNELRMRMDAIRKQCGETMPETGVAIGVSAVYSDAQSLEEAFKEAKMAALQVIVAGGSDDSAGGTGYCYDAARMQEWTEAFQRRIAHRQIREAQAMVQEWIALAPANRFSAYMMQDWFAMAVKSVNTLNQSANTDAAALLTDKLIYSGAPRKAPESATKQGSTLQGYFMVQRSLLDYRSLEEAGEDLAGHLCMLADRARENEAQTDIVDSIKAYVDAHYKSRIQLEELARSKYFVDPDYLSRLFKRKSGVRFSQYLLEVRMEKARKMLLEAPELSVSEVASEVGFNDYSYFIQMYKKVYGETPGKFRSYNGTAE